MPGDVYIVSKAYYFNHNVLQIGKNLDWVTIIRGHILQPKIEPTKRAAEHISLRGNWQNAVKKLLG